MCNSCKILIVKTILVDERCMIAFQTNKKTKLEVIEEAKENDCSIIRECFLLVDLLNVKIISKNMQHFQNCTIHLCRLLPLIIIHIFRSSRTTIIDFSKIICLNLLPINPSF